MGQSITLNKQAMTVAGVLPPTFDFGSVFSPGLKIDVYVPIVMDQVRGWGNTLAIVGRLRPGVSVKEAQAEADVLFPQLKAAHPEWWGDCSSYSHRPQGLRQRKATAVAGSLVVRGRSDSP